MSPISPSAGLVCLSVRNVCLSVCLANLRDVEEVPRAGLRKRPPKERPQLAQDPEERGLAAAIWSADENVHARADLG